MSNNFTGRDGAAELTRQGIEAYKRGDKTGAQELLRRATLVDPQSETAWLWLSGLVSSGAEQRHCLERALAINPDNQAARRGLAALPPAPASPAERQQPAQSEVSTTAEAGAIRPLPSQQSQPGVTPALGAIRPLPSTQSQAQPGSTASVVSLLQSATPATGGQAAPFAPAAGAQTQLPYPPLVGQPYPSQGGYPPLVGQPYPPQGYPAQPPLKKKGRPLWMSIIFALAILFIGCSVIAAGLRATREQASAPPAPTITPIPGWHKLSGSGFEIWLPQSFAEQEANDDLEFQAADTRSGRSGIETTVVVGQDRSSLSMGKYMDSAMRQIEAEFGEEVDSFNVVKRDVIQINGAETGRATVEVEVEGFAMTQVYYIYKSSSRVWLVCFFVDSQEYDRYHDIFEKSARSFRIT